MSRTLKLKGAEFKNGIKPPKSVCYIDQSTSKKVSEQESHQSVSIKSSLRESSNDLLNSTESCTLCKTPFKNESIHGQHIVNHSGVMPYFCVICYFSSVSKFHLQTHMKQHLPTSAKYMAITGCEYECEICECFFGKYTQLQRHWELHLREMPFSCEKCMLWFSEESDMVIHSHLHKEALKCDICFKLYPSRNDLLLHVPMHNKSKLFQKFELYTSNHTYREYRKKLANDGLFQNIHKRGHHSGLNCKQEMEFTDYPVPASPVNKNKDVHKNKKSFVNKSRPNNEENESKPFEEAVKSINGVKKLKGKAKKEKKNIQWMNRLRSCVSSNPDKVLSLKKVLIVLDKLPNFVCDMNSFRKYNRELKPGNVELKRRRVSPQTKQNDFTWPNYSAVFSTKNNHVIKNINKSVSIVNMKVSKLSSVINQYKKRNLRNSSNSAHFTKHSLEKNSIIQIDSTFLNDKTKINISNAHNFSTISESTIHGDAFVYGCQSTCSYSVSENEDSEFDVRGGVDHLCEVVLIEGDEIVINAPIRDKNNVYIIPLNRIVLDTGACYEVYTTNDDTDKDNHIFNFPNSSFHSSMHYNSSLCENGASKNNLESENHFVSSENVLRHHNYASKSIAAKQQTSLKIPSYMSKAKSISPISKSRRKKHLLNMQSKKMKFKKRSRNSKSCAFEICPRKVLYESLKYKQNTDNTYKIDSRYSKKARKCRSTAKFSHLKNNNSKKRKLQKSSKKLISMIQFKELSVDIYRLPEEIYLKYLKRKPIMVSNILPLVQNVQSLRAQLATQIMTDHNYFIKITMSQIRQLSHEHNYSLSQSSENETC